MRKKNLVILGSTGTIGTQALSLFDSTNLGEKYSIYGLCVFGKNLEMLLEQVGRYHPARVVVYARNAALELKRILAGRAEVLEGDAGTEALITDENTDVVLIAISGTAAIKPTYIACKAGKAILLANKESLVSAGEILMKTAEQNGARIIPVDSEHNAVFQILRGLENTYIKQVLLTASGGPFLNYPKSELRNVKPQQALSHPTWKMGPLITINSATLMNKGQEIIEAHYLFRLPYEKIDAVIHPQAVIHSLVEFIDGAIMAQMSVPDMRIPLLYALTHPERIEAPLPCLSLTELGSLTFLNVDPNRYPCYEIARMASEKGGLAPAVMNAANEIAVSFFLQEKIRFTDIPLIIEKTLNELEKQNWTLGSIEDVYSADEWAKKTAATFASSLSTEAV